MFLFLIAGIWFFLGYRDSRKFNEEFHTLPDKDKKKYLLQKGTLNCWKFASFTNFPEPFATLCKIIAWLTLLALLSIIILSAIVILFE